MLIVAALVFALWPRHREGTPSAATVTPTVSTTSSTVRSSLTTGQAGFREVNLTPSGCGCVVRYPQTDATAPTPTPSGPRRKTLEFYGYRMPI